MISLSQRWIAKSPLPPIVSAVKPTDNGAITVRTTLVEAGDFFFCRCPIVGVEGGEDALDCLVRR